MKPYCTQNAGNCPTCSLASYNRDCCNNPIWGGARPGSGRPTVTELRRSRTFKATDEEWTVIKQNAEQVGMSASEYIRQKTLGA